MKDGEGKISGFLNTGRVESGCETMNDGGYVTKRRRLFSTPGLLTKDPSTQWVAASTAHIRTGWNQA